MNAVMRPGCQRHMKAGCYHNLLPAKAVPDPDLRYFSNSDALDSSEKARYVISFQGLNLEVWVERPSL